MHKERAFVKLRTRLSAIALALFACAPPLHAADAILDEVIAAARTRGVNGHLPDWPVVEREAYVLLAASPGEAGRTTAIRHVLGALKDGHSFYMPPPPSSAPSGAAAGTSTGNPAARTPKPIAQAHGTVEGVGHLAINAWSGGSAETPAATRDVRDALNQSLANAPCGLIIDVAHNPGGNMWPMMGGIAPLYDEGVLETFQGRSGAPQVVNVRDGQLRMNESVFPRVELPALVRKPAHLAVILGPGTMSSGEILALGFKGQRNVRFFGQPTRGATTANASMRLSNGGMVALTTAHIQDRRGVIHQGPVVPDETTDQPLQAARAWLVKQCAQH
ncbi:S41 family peptidase [Pseudoxanthomonas sp. CCNWLW251]